MKIHVYDELLGLRTLKKGVTFEQFKEKFPDSFKVNIPSAKTLELWESRGFCKTPCGCKVEPDGVCYHGNKSWLLLLNLI